MSALDYELPEEDPSGWQGVLFRSLGQPLVVPLVELSEVLLWPVALTRVPGTKPWFLGVANLRGTLVSVTDLDRFLGGESIVPGRRSRILVARRPELQAGLLVEEVLAMRQFQTAASSAAGAVEGTLASCVSGAAVSEGESWPLFSMDVLAQIPAFLEVAP